MARAHWALRHGRPCVEVVLTLAADGQPFPRILLSDTGAGSRTTRLQLILDEEDCLLCGGNPRSAITLAGAYTGSFPTYVLRAQIPVLGFDRTVRAVGVPSLPVGFDGIACFAFLNRFTYGNFGNAGQLGPCPLSDQAAALQVA